MNQKRDICLDRLAFSLFFLLAGAFNGLHCSSGFWGGDNENVLQAIHNRFVEMHRAMWKEISEFL